MFFAIRRHNNQIAAQVSAHQLSVMFRREKKVAEDMGIVTVVLVACLGPITVGDKDGSAIVLSPILRHSLSLGIYDDLSQFICESFTLFDS